MSLNHRSSTREDRLRDLRQKAVDAQFELAQVAEIVSITKILDLLQELIDELRGVQ